MALIKFVFLTPEIRPVRSINLTSDISIGLQRVLQRLPISVLLFWSLSAPAANLGTFRVNCAYNAGQEMVDLYPRAGDTFTITMVGGPCDQTRYLQNATPITTPGNGSYSGSRTFTFTSTPSSVNIQLLASNQFNSGTRFYFNKPPFPSVTTVEPTSGTTAGGTSITLRGTNFTEASSITVGGLACTNVSVIDAETAQCTTPAKSAGTASINITTPGGTNWNNRLFTYKAPVPPAPTVSSLSPTSGTTAGGTTITITGTGFTGAAGIAIGGLPCAGFTVTNTTSATCTTPPGNAGTASVDVTTPNGTNSANALFTYIQPPPHCDSGIA